MSSVVVGTNTLSYGGDRYFVGRTIVHQRFNPTNIVNDVGLVFLNQDIRFYNLVHPIKLPTRDIDYDNYPAVVSGWGKMKVSYVNLYDIKKLFKIVINIFYNQQINGSPTNKLQYLQTCLMDRSTCARKVPTASVYQKICTFTFPGQGVCQVKSKLFCYDCLKNLLTRILIVYREILEVRWWLMVCRLE